MPPTARVARIRTRMSNGKARPTILVVDDEPEMRKLICAMIAHLPYEVIPASGGLLAVAMHKLFRPIDLLITDVVMPGMSGPVLADKLTSLQPDLKVLYISGYQHTQVVRKYVVEKGHVLLAKPFTAGVLEALVRELLPKAMKAGAQ